MARGTRRLTLELLDIRRREISRRKILRRRRPTGRITCHIGTCSIWKEARVVLLTFLCELLRSGRNDIDLGSSWCIGPCNREPLVTVEILGCEPVVYDRVDVDKARTIFRKHVTAGKVPKALVFVRGYALNGAPPHCEPPLDGLVSRASTVPFYAGQRPWLLRNRGWIDPEKIEDYIWRDGYRALSRAFLEMNREELVTAIQGANLPDGLMTAGRGGTAGYQHAVIDAAAVRLACLSGASCGARLEPRLLEADPHSVLEGMGIAAKAVGASRGLIECLPQYPLSGHRAEQAIDQARSMGLLGPDILGSGFSFDVEVTRRSIPRSAPLVCSNAETYVNITRFIQLGPECYAKMGHGEAKGTRLVVLGGGVRFNGLVEVPAGLAVEDLEHGIGGGVSTSNALPNSPAGL